MAKYRTHTLVIDEVKIPVRIYQERRRSVRASIGKENVNLRMPTGMGMDFIQKQITWLERWLNSEFQKKPRLKIKFTKNLYVDGDSLIVGDQHYKIAITQGLNKGSQGRLKNGEIRLKLSHDLTDDQVQDVTVKLIRRLVAKDHLPRVSQRIHELNDQYFHQEIKGIKLKYNTSNWGSCSTKGNVNISTRILLAPHDVQDYVFIHELSHLIVMDHSPKFWKVVSDIMPSYKEKEKWLSTYGHQCNI